MEFWWSSKRNGLKIRLELNHISSSEIMNEDFATEVQIQACVNRNNGTAYRVPIYPKAT